MSRISRLILKSTNDYISNQQAFCKQLKQETEDTKNIILSYYEEIASQTKKKQTNYTIGSVTGFLPIINFFTQNTTVKKVVSMLTDSTKSFPEILNANQDANISLYSGKRSIEEFSLRSKTEDSSRISNDMKSISELCLHLIKAANE